MGEEPSGRADDRARLSGPDACLLVGWLGCRFLGNGFRIGGNGIRETGLGVVIGAIGIAGAEARSHGAQPADGVDDAGRVAGAVENPANQ